MWDDDTVTEAIANHPLEAADALAAIQLGRQGGILKPEGLKCAADAVDEPVVAKFWTTMLKARSLLPDFVLALQARGVQIERVRLPSYDATHWQPGALEAFMARASLFRCQILANSQVCGSGILAGPGSVLTAWHVIAVAPPDKPQEPAPQIEVLLANGKRIGAALRYSSFCGDVEYAHQMPVSDEEIQGRNDLALLALREPAGLHLSFAALPPEPCECRDNSAFLLVHYPEGRYRGHVFGKLMQIRDLTGRWRHDILDTASGSSGGGCFDTRFQLAGLHQGRHPESGGRLVPAGRFGKEVRQHLARDEIPDSVWSLDGTPTGELVIGREAFFFAYAAAMRGAKRVRGLWVQRTDARNDVSGLPFSRRLLDRMVARSPATRLVVIEFNELVRDLPDEIARRVAAAGVPVAPVAPLDGVAAAHAELEAVVADRSRRLATAIDTAVREAGLRLWLFFDHPKIVFGDAHRWALTAFIDQALKEDGLRLAIAGYEAMQLPGTTFQNPDEAAGDGMPGLLVEYLAGFTRLDVQNLIRSAVKDFGRGISDERVQELVDDAVAGLTATTGVFYESWMAAEVGKRLQPKLRELQDKAMAS